MAVPQDRGQEAAGFPRAHPPVTDMVRSREGPGNKATVSGEKEEKASGLPEGGELDVRRGPDRERLHMRETKSACERVPLGSGSQNQGCERLPRASRGPVFTQR